MINAYLSGPFRLITEDGKDLTPHSAKICALLLLLLTSETGSRERSWIKSQLWSDRGDKQSSGSLRTALHSCKALFGDYPGTLITSNLRVSLALDHFTIHTDGPGEFAEGLDVKDPAFEDFLREERARRETKEAAFSQVDNQRREGPIITLTIQRESCSDMLANWLVEVLADQCAMLLEHMIGAKVILPKSDTVVDAEFDLELSAVQAPDGWLLLRGRLENKSGQVWANRRVIKTLESNPDENEDSLQFVFEIIDAIRRKFNQSEYQFTEDAPALNANAITHMFKMTQSGAENAERLLMMAHSREPHAVQIAWQSQVRVIQFFEKYRDGGLALLDESQALARRAVEIAPQNSIVLALTGNTLNHIRGHAHEAAEFAQLSVRAGPGNPFAWWTLASVQLSSGDAEEAYRSAQKSKMLMNGSELEFLPESILGGAALAMGREHSALQHFERSLTFRPGFKPSIRYALGLNAKRGNMDRARLLTKRLKKDEHGFRAEQLVEDGAYPTALFRLIEGMDRRVLRDIG